jgi:hypothetical protein
MFCPLCKAEYRLGFTVCADCEVPLVWQLPGGSHQADGEGASGQDTGASDDPFCTFWNGDDPRIHAELCELLDEEGIPHKTIRREDHLFNLNSKSAFQIGIPFSCFEKAEAAIKEAYGTEEDPADTPNLLPAEKEHVTEAGIFAGLLEMAKDLGRDVRGMKAILDEPRLEAEDSTAGDPQSQYPNWDPDHWYTEDAKTEVWSGDQPELGEMIAASLRENQIHARLDCTEGNCALFVLPDDASRAREIVREIIAASPPE